MDRNRINEAAEAKKAKIFLRREQAAETVGRDTNDDFKKFKNAFFDNIDLLRTQLASIYASDYIDADRLYDMAEDILSSMQHKVDALLYLNAIYSSEYFIVEHCMRVGLLAQIFAQWLELDEATQKEVTVAGFLHDIGMFQVPKAIIEKEGPLTDDEVDVMREHTTRGAMMLTNKGVSDSIVEVALSHHERYDGSGYPDAKKGGQTDRLASIISIVDSYDSMTSNRPYSTAKCPFDVMTFFEREMLDKFDPGLLYVFLENIPYMYKNVLVKLSNGNQAKVVFINTQNKTSPIVQLEKNGEFIDLSMRRDLKIVSLL